MLVLVLVCVQFSTRHFEVHSFTHSKDMIGIPKLKKGVRDHDHALSKRFVTHRLGLAVINISAKFDFFISTGYEDIR